MLELNRVNVSYGPVHVLKDIRIKVNRGEIVALVGANGAGKTTMMRTISGLLKAHHGSEIIFDGRRIENLRPEALVRMGIAHVPEGRRVFPGLTVRENLEMGAVTRLRRLKITDEIERDIEHVYDLFPRLRERENQLAWSLSGGEQQMLAIGRGLMTRPKLLLLDEPSLGLAPLLVEELFRIIKSINEQGTTILLVEQNAAMALQIAHRGYVIETGRIVLEGPGPELLDNPAVIDAYLGGHRTRSA